MIILIVGSSPPSTFDAFLRGPWPSCGYIVNFDDGSGSGDVMTALIDSA